MQNSSSPSPILDFGRQHVIDKYDSQSRDCCPTIRSFAPKGKISYHRFQGHCRRDPSKLSRGPLLKDVLAQSGMKSTRPTLGQKVDQEILFSPRHPCC